MEIVSTQHGNILSSKGYFISKGYFFSPINRYNSQILTRIHILKKNINNYCLKTKQLLVMENIHIRREELFKITCLLQYKKPITTHKITSYFYKLPFIYEILATVTGPEQGQ